MRYRAAGDAFDEARKQRTQLDDEIPRHQQRAEREHDVARQPHPLPEQCRVVERAAARIGEAMLVDGVELRPADREEVEADPQHQPAIVEPERPQPEPLAERMPVGRDIAQAEIDQPDRQQAEGAEQRRMGVVEGQEGAVLVVIDQRRVQRAAAEDAGADEVPERRADDVGVGEPVLELAAAP